MNRNHLIVLGSFVAVFVLLCYAGWAVLIKPVQAEIVATQASEQTAQGQLDDAKSKAAQYDQFKAQAENVQRDLDIISQRLDPNVTAREKERVIDKIMTGSGVRTWKITTDFAQKVGKSKLPGFTSLNQIDIEYEFWGGFDELGEICNRIVSNPRILCPESLTIESWSKDSYLDPTIHVTNFVVSFFVEPPEDAAEGNAR